MTLMLTMINCANLCLCILWINECILGSWNSVLLELPWENGDSLGGTRWSMSEFSWDVKYAGVQTHVEICYMSTWTSLYDNLSVKHLNYVTSALPHEQAVVSLAVFAIINLSLFLYHVDLFNFIICIPFWVLENTTLKSWKFHQFMWIWKLSTLVI